LADAEVADCDADELSREAQRFFTNLSGRANDSRRGVRQSVNGDTVRGKVARVVRHMMNYSEQVALQFLQKTHAWVTDPTFNLADWSATICILSLAVLVFVCSLAASE
jgi:hypothetical protein